MKPPTRPTLFPDLPETPRRPKETKLPNRPVWTEQKARLISAYLRLFTFITRHGTYIDGFAGPQYPSDSDSWSARLALKNEPRWLRDFVLCDVDKSQVAHLEALRIEQPALPKGPKRHVQVMEGDFNRIWPQALRAGRITDSVASFCVLDQRTFECEWKTVQGISRFKAPDRKIELFYFLPIHWVDRAIAALNDKSVVERWWGGPGWQAFREASRPEKGPLFAERLRSELGYADVRPYPIMGREVGGHVMYQMIHATDHPEAPGLMARAYRIASLTPDKAEQLALRFLAKLPQAPG